MADQALLLEFDERLERLGERAGLGTFGVAESEVDQIEYVEPEGREVVVDLAAQIFGSPGRGPATLFVAGRAHLGYDVQRLWIGVQCLGDQLVGDPRPVGVAGVDVVTPRLTASRKTARVPSRSAGGPITHGPASCMAP